MFEINLFIRGIDFHDNIFQKQGKNIFMVMEITIKSFSINFQLENIREKFI